MLISVLTVVYNDIHKISTTIESVISQTEKDFEYIIIDGCSTDGTYNEILRYKDFIHKVLSEEDSGIYNAMNKAIDLSTGDYLIFMNSGDVFDNIEILKNVRKAIIDNDNPDLVYGTYRNIENGDSAPIPNRKYTKYWFGMFASHQSMFYKKELIDHYHIRYDESYKIAADYKFTLEFIKHTSHVLRLPLCISRFDNSGISRQHETIGLREADRARKEVLGMNILLRQFVILLQLSSRFIRHHFKGLYIKLRQL